MSLFLPLYLSVARFVRGVVRWVWKSGSVRGMFEHSSVGAASPGPFFMLQAVVGAVGIVGAMVGVGRCKGRGGRLLCPFMLLLHSWGVRLLRFNVPCPCSVAWCVVSCVR